MNPFVHRSAARRYAAARPYYQPAVIARIRQALPLAWPVARALDAGCGTGMSTAALKALAREIVGLDCSPAMLGEKSADPALRFVKGRVESMPFPAGRFDLVTAASAFHWFDGDRFLAEARRVLAPGGRLVIYDHSFRGRLKGNPDFRRWHRETYLVRYPAPPRNWTPPHAEQARRCGLELERQEEFTTEATFTPEALGRYLTTQSNVIAAAERGGEDVARILDWLVRSARPFFSGPEATFVFGGPIFYLQAAGG